MAAPNRWLLCFTVILSVTSVSFAAEPTVSARAFLGKPFGVGEVVIRFPDDARPKWYGDQQPRVVTAGERVLYPAWIADSAPYAPDLESLRVYFLFSGPAERSIEVHATDIYPAQLVPADDEKAHRRLLEQWWSAYHRSDVHQLDSGPSAQVKNFLRTMLGRRLALPARGGVSPTSTLDRVPMERFINDSLGLLIGSTSIRAALQNERMLSAAPLQEPADQPFPKATAPPAVPLPEKIKPDTLVETIAFHTPAECFYVRCKRFADYLWLRDLVNAWGGTVDNLVGQESFDYGLRGSVERRLALAPDAAAREVLNNALSDLAIIGTDLFFRDGPSVGVLLEAKNDREVAAVIRRQRDAVRAEAGATEEEVMLGGRSAQLLTTADGTVRSFYAVSGKYHLVTTSQWIARRFLECEQGTGSLGELDEFRYARQKMPLSRGDEAFLYLSDPFFRTLVGPKYRVEMTRRAAALADVQLVELARLAAAGEGRPLSSVEELRDAGFLPPHFGTRADGNRAEVVAGRVRDSLRGIPGGFLPIPDVEITGITSTEAKSYEAFAREYQAQWQRMDPVTIALARKPGPDGRETVALDFVITPYAVAHYGFMANFLTSSPRRLSVKQDLLAVLEATPQAHWTGGVTLFAGVKDLAPPFRIERGQIVPDVAPLDAQGTLDAVGAKAPFIGFAADNAEGMRHMLTMIDSFGEIQRGKPDLGGYVQVNRGANRNHFFPDLVRWGRLQKQTAVFGVKREDLELITPDLKLVPAERPAQIRLRTKDLRDAKFGRAVDAAGYLGARHLSAVNAQLLWQFDQQLNLDPAQIPAASARVVGGRPRCPLGGKYQLDDGKAAPALWSSSAWDMISMEQIDRAPPDYRYPFTAWLRELSIDFEINATTLSTHVEVTLKP